MAEYKEYSLIWIVTVQCVLKTTLKTKEQSAIKQTVGFQWKIGEFVVCLISSESINWNNFSLSSFACILFTLNDVVSLQLQWKVTVQSKGEYAVQKQSWAISVEGKKKSLHANSLLFIVGSWAVRSWKFWKSLMLSVGAGWHILYMPFEILNSNGSRSWETEKPWGWSLWLPQRRGTVEVLAVQISPFCLWFFVTNTKIFIIKIHWSELIFSICTQVFRISTKTSSFFVGSTRIWLFIFNDLYLAIFRALGQEIFIAFDDLGEFYEGVFEFLLSGHCTVQDGMKYSEKKGPNLEMR